MKQQQSEQRERYPLTLEPQMMAKIREEAKKNYRSVNGQIQFILEQHFAEKQT